MNNKDIKVTVLEMINHLLINNPELVQNVVQICDSLQTKKNEFQLIINEWFSVKGDSTLRLDYPLDTESVVFDLGGYLGDFSEEINDKYGCFVHLFEPSKIFYENCNQRFINNNKIKCYNYGLSNKDGIFNLSNDLNASSINENINKEFSQQVVVKKIESVFQELKIDHIDLIKINVEGSEFEILEDLISSGYISIINNLQIQFHEFAPNSWKLRDDIRIKLTKTHDEIWNYPFVWESWRKKI